MTIFNSMTVIMNEVRVIPAPISAFQALQSTSWATAKLWSNRGYSKAAGRRLQVAEDAESAIRIETTQMILAFDRT
jgi:hypothetical protein